MSGKGHPEYMKRKNEKDLFVLVPIKIDPHLMEDNQIYVLRDRVDGSREFFFSGNNVHVMDMGNGSFEYSNVFPLKDLGIFLNLKDRLLNITTEKL